MICESLSIHSETAVMTITMTWAVFPASCYAYDKHVSKVVYVAGCRVDGARKIIYAQMRI